MVLTNRVRPAHPLLDHLAFRQFTSQQNDTALPDGGSWDLIIIRPPTGPAQAIVTGATTRPVNIGFSPGYAVTTICFKPHVFMPHISARAILNQGIVLPKAGRNKIWIGSQTVELPTFDNGEIFVDKLQRTGLLAGDNLVASMLSGNPLAASERSVQRHFLNTTGLTLQTLRQINRAGEAVRLLRTGMRIADVAHHLGFTDQSHLTKTLKAIMGLTPAAIRRTS